MAKIFSKLKIKTIWGKPVIMAKNPFETKIPGIKSLHRFVTKECRKRPEMAWRLEVLEDVEKQLKELHKAWPSDSDVKFHVAVTVEYPK